jgi:hypothetical protein
MWCSNFMNDYKLKIYKLKILCICVEVANHGKNIY